jgi:hypothetical protein
MLVMEQLAELHWVQGPISMLAYWRLGHIHFMFQNQMAAAILQELLLGHWLILRLLHQLHPALQFVRAIQQHLLQQHQEQYNGTPMLQ